MCKKSWLFASMTCPKIPGKVCGFGGVALVVSLGKKTLACPVSVEVSLFVPLPPQSPKDGDKPALSFLIVLSKKQFRGNLLFHGKKDHYFYWLQWMRSSLGTRTRDCKYPPSFAIVGVGACQQVDWGTSEAEGTALGMTSSIERVPPARFLCLPRPPPKFAYREGGAGRADGSI